MTPAPDDPGNPGDPGDPGTPRQPAQAPDTHIWHTATPRASGTGSTGNRLLAVAFIVLALGLVLLCVFLAFGSVNGS